MAHMPRTGCPLQSIGTKMMNASSRRSDRDSEKEIQGLQLDFTVPVWEVTSPREFSPFVRALVDLLPSGCIAYLEGGAPRRGLKSFVDENSVPEVAHVPIGTIVPRPQVHHVFATETNLLRLAHVAEGLVAPEIVYHFHVYQPGRMLLQWHDAFDRPLYIAMEIPEEKLRDFSMKLGVVYRVTKD